MEKNYTLMKTLTAAFFDLLFSRRKNSRIVTNDRTSTTGGCGNGTTVHDHLKYMNDPDMSGSFLFFEQAVTDGRQSTVDSPRSIEDDRKIKSKEELKKVNDELAQRNVPKPVYNNWKERVNDDLAACTQVDDPLFPPKNSYKRKNDNINVDHIFTISDTTTTINNHTTRTKRNDAFRPFASFSFLFIVSFKALKFLQQNNFKRNSEPVFIPIRTCDKSKMRFSQNRFSQKN